MGAIIQTFGTLMPGLLALLGCKFYDGWRSRILSACWNPLESLSQQLTIISDGGSWLETAGLEQSG
jgi:hypothetical protein